MLARPSKRQDLRLEAEELERRDARVGVEAPTEVDLTAVDGGCTQVSATVRVVERNLNLQASRWKAGM